MKTFRDLIVWQKSMDIVTLTYKTTKTFPVDERFGLTLQLRRSSVSIPSNIAEGYGRFHVNDYKRFLQIAIASLYELQTQFEIALNLEFIEKNEYNNLFEKCKEIEKMLCSLINKLK